MLKNYGLNVPAGFLWSALALFILGTFMSFSADRALLQALDKRGIREEVSATVTRQAVSFDSGGETIR
jgi:hypothetical protein